MAVAVCRLEQISLHLDKMFKDAMPVSFRSELFTSYILTTFKQGNILPLI